MTLLSRKFFNWLKCWASLLLLEPRVQSKKATFGLNAAKVRRLVNPKAPVRSCRVTLHRNLSGFNVTDLSKSQRLQIETLMKKVMGVAYMPEEITGKYQR